MYYRAAQYIQPPSTIVVLHHVGPFKKTSPRRKKASLVWESRMRTRYFLNLLLCNFEQSEQQQIANRRWQNQLLRSPWSIFVSCLPLLLPAPLF